MICQEIPYQNDSVFPLFSRQTSEYMAFRREKRKFVFPLFSEIEIIGKLRPTDYW